MTKPVPGWAWVEDFDADQKAGLAIKIVAELDGRLGADRGTRIYAATKHAGLPAQSDPSSIRLFELVRICPRRTILWLATGASGDTTKRTSSSRAKP